MKKLFALHLLTALLLLLSACDNTAGGTMESGAPAPHSSTNQSVNEQASSQAPQEQTDTATSQITRERAVEIALEKATLKKDGTFEKPLMQKAHDFFNFKKLYVESILKVIYTFSTIFTFVSGLLTAVLGSIIYVGARWIDWLDMSESYRRYTEGYWGDTFGRMAGIFFGGILAAVIMPIILRLVYELFMMFVLLVKNTIDINNKLKKQD